MALLAARFFSNSSSCESICAFALAVGDACAKAARSALAAGENGSTGGKLLLPPEADPPGLSTMLSDANVGVSFTEPMLSGPNPAEVNEELNGRVRAGVRGAVEKPYDEGDIGPPMEVNEDGTGAYGDDIGAVGDEYENADDGAYGDETGGLLEFNPLLNAGGGERNIAG